jgi:hypothetical protein
MNYRFNIDKEQIASHLSVATVIHKIKIADNFIAGLCKLRCVLYYAMGASQPDKTISP